MRKKLVVCGIAVISLVLHARPQSFKDSIRTFVQQNPNGLPPIPRTDLIQPSPNAAAFEKYLNVPVNLARGTVNTSIPIYTATDGSLSMPIALSYNFSGNRPSEPASWVGLGWNLSSGGVITRQVRSKLDNTIGGGQDYDEYSIGDTLQQPNKQQFLRAVADFDAYDTEADIYSYNFNGHSGRFIISKGKAYLTSYEKIKIIPGDDVNFVIVTDDGTKYTFGVTETTYTKPAAGAYAPPSYVSAWYLTEIESASGKDHITFSYSGTFNYRAPSGNLSEVYTITSAVDGICVQPSRELRETFNASPRIDAISLVSIETRNAYIQFDTLPRYAGSVHEYPALGTVKIFNKGEAASNLVQRWQFDYDTASGKLQLTDLKRLSINRSPVNHEYRFGYNGGASSGAFTRGIDYWGYDNGAAGNYWLFPADAMVESRRQYLPADRDPHFTAVSSGVLTSIRYPTGGSSLFEYELNDYSEDGVVNTPGPGIRVKRIVNNDSLTSNVMIRTFRYTKQNDSVSSGVPPMRVAYTIRSTDYDLIDPETGADCYSNTTTYQSDYGTGADKFYYATVTEIDTGYNGESHETQYDFEASQLNWDLGIKQVEKRTYATHGTVKTLVEKENTWYKYYEDKIFFGLLTAWASSITAHDPANNNVYEYFDGTDYISWLPVSETIKTTFDENGNSLTTYSSNQYDSHRNLAFTRSTLSTGDTLVSKMKYPEDYTDAITGGLLRRDITGVPIETQVWLKKNGTDSLLQGAQITWFDTIICAPIEKYYLESQPLASLDNESTSSGLYSTLLSDSHYKKRLAFGYEYYGNVDHQQMSDNVLMSYLWDYNAALPIAQVVNAASTDVGYAGFESFTGGGWTGMIADSVHFDSLNSAMGQRYYHLVSSLSRSGLDTAKSYTVSYWSRNGSLSVNSTSGTSIYTANGWTLYTHTVSHPSGGTITASGTAFIDELRVLPANAQMTTYAYKPGIGMIGQGDLNNFPTHYHYDGLNRLQTVQDKDRNIIKTIDYHYKGQ